MVLNDEQFGKTALGVILCHGVLYSMQKLWDTTVCKTSKFQYYRQYA